MDLIDSILIPIPGKNILECDNYALSNAFYLSSFFNSKPHFIVPADALSQFREKLSLIDTTNWTIAIHESFGNFFQDIFATAKQEGISLLVLGTNQVSFSKANNHLNWEQEIIQYVQIPLIICPVNFNLARKPLKSILVPMSGEIRMNSALAIALRIAYQIKMPIDLIHVTSRTCEYEDTSLLGHLSDHFYHEYPRLVERLISEGSPFSSLRERRLIRKFWHCWGNEANEILKLSTKNISALLVLEWKGILLKGHAAILKFILSNCNQAVLLVRQASQGTSLLKVGKDFRVA